MNTKQFIWNWLYNKIQNPYGVAGLMGNLFAESGLNSNNLQNTFNTSLGLTDDEYTKKVDNGSYSRDQFINDKAGYGLAQWTYWTRKRNLYDYIKNNNKSIADIEAQLEFLYEELKNGYYNSVLIILENTNNIEDASNAVLLKFERPLDQSDWMKNVRINYSNQIYQECYNNEEIDFMSNDEKFLELFNNFRETLQDNDCASWSAEARDWIVNDAKLMKGGNPLPDGSPNYMWQDFLTREQLAQVLYAFAKYLGKA